MITEAEQDVGELFDSNVPSSSQQHSIAQAAVESLNQKLAAVNRQISELTLIVHEPTAEVKALRVERTVIEMKGEKIHGCRFRQTMDPDRDR